MDPLMVSFGGLIVALNILPAIIRSVRNINNKHRGRPHSTNRFEGLEKEKTNEEQILDEETYSPAYKFVPFNIYNLMGYRGDDHHRR